MQTDVLFSRQRSISQTRRHVLSALVVLMMLGWFSLTNQASAQALPVVSIVAVDDTGSEDGDTITFRLTRTDSTASDLIVFMNISCCAGFATILSDFDTTPFLSAFGNTIPAGSASLDILVSPVDDARVEGDEILGLILVDRPTYDLGSPSSADATILDNEFPLVSIEAIDASGSEDGDTITFRLIRIGSTVNSLDVSMILSVETGFADLSDLTPLVVGQRATILAGESFADLVLSPADDALIEGTETLRLVVLDSATFDLASPSTADATILDNDAIAITETPTSEPGSIPTPEASVPPPPPVPLCDQIGNETSAVVRAQVADGTVTDGAVFCRVLNENGTFIGDVGHVGDAYLISRGVLQAVDVFGLTAGGNSVTQFNSPVYLCLQGRGDLFYADASNAPRVYAELDGIAQDSFTCANIPNAGTLVLVQPSS